MGGDSMDKLRPCPVCGNHRLSFVNSAIGSRVTVLCEECGQMSGWHDTKNKAVEAWNRDKETTLIDVDKLIKHIGALADNIRDAGGQDVIVYIRAISDVIGVIKKQESVDAVKHGHWIIRNSVGSASCSACGGTIYNAYDKDANRYCHCCGARMDKKEGGK